MNPKTNKSSQWEPHEESQAIEDILNPERIEQALAESKCGDSLDRVSGIG